MTAKANPVQATEGRFQYRKRYEVTCDSAAGGAVGDAAGGVSIPQAV